METKINLREEISRLSIKTQFSPNLLEKDLIPLYACMVQGSEGRKTGFVEGVVFTHPDGRMAKLRKDMFNWFKGKRHNNGHQEKKKSN